MSYRALPPDSKPACAGRFDLFDAAMGGSRESNEAKAQMYRECCSHCPVTAECLDVAVVTRSLGHWAGTNANAARNIGNTGKRRPIKLTLSKKDRRRDSSAREDRGAGRTGESHQDEPLQPEVEALDQAPGSVD